MPDRTLCRQLSDLLYRCRDEYPTAILSDGDVVFQPRKIRQAGIHAAVAGQVMIYIHKEEELADVERQLIPQSSTIFVDDKPRLIRAIKNYWGERVTTVWPRQGHYAAEIGKGTLAEADVTIEKIGDLQIEVIARKIC